MSRNWAAPPATARGQRRTISATSRPTGARGCCRAWCATRCSDRWRILCRRSASRESTNPSSQTTRAAWPARFAGATRSSSPRNTDHKPARFAAGFRRPVTRHTGRRCAGPARQWRGATAHRSSDPTPQSSPADSRRRSPHRPALRPEARAHFPRFPEDHVRPSRVAGSVE